MYINANSKVTNNIIKITDQIHLHNNIIYIYDYDSMMYTPSLPHTTTLNITTQSPTTGQGLVGGWETPVFQRLHVSP